MKALCIREPWASKIASGEKTIETRTWRTNYRGRILLCASQKPKGPLAGKAFAVATIAAVHPMQPHEEKAACCKTYPKAISWVLTDVNRIIRPIPMKARLGVFNTDVQPGPVACSKHPVDGDMKCSECWARLGELLRSANSYVAADKDTKVLLDS